MTPETGGKGRTTVSLSRDVHARLSRLKPYESVSYSEFIDELADAYETERAPSGD